MTSCNSEKSKEKLFYNSLRKKNDVLKNEKNIIKWLYDRSFDVDGKVIKNKRLLAEYLSKNYKGKNVYFISEYKLTSSAIDDFINFFHKQGVILKGFFVPYCLGSQEWEGSADVLPFYLKTYPEKNLPESVIEIRRNIQAGRAKRAKIDSDGRPLKKANSSRK
jgi:hypothetical protein